MIALPDFCKQCGAVLDAIGVHDCPMKDLNKFMQGYKRDPEVTEKLIAALRNALYANPNQRLGQLLMNLNQQDKMRDIWNIYDEKWIELLREYVDE